MKRSSRTIANVLVLALLAQGCAGMQASGDKKSTFSTPEQCIAAYTAGGAILGAAAGFILGGKNRTQAALAGGAAGGVIAFAIAWGSCFQQFANVKSEPVRGSKDVKESVGYDASKGTDIKIVSYKAVPSYITKGSSIKLIARYYVLMPNDTEHIKVTETVEMYSYDPNEKKYNFVGKKDEEVTAEPGERRSTIEFTVPDSAPIDDKKMSLDNRIKYVFKVATVQTQDSSEMAFAEYGVLTLTQDRNLLAKGEAELAAFQREVTQTTTSEPAAKTETIASNQSAGSRNIAPEPAAKTVADASNQSVSPRSITPEKIAPTRYAVITARQINTREHPEAKAKVVAKVSRNEKYPVLSDVLLGKVKWIQIDLGNGKTAWLTIKDGATVVEK
jgi:hypothetical protein